MKRPLLPIISLSLLLLLDYSGYSASIPPPILTLHFSAKVRPSKLFDDSPFAHGRGATIHMNSTAGDSNTDLMISESDYNFSNQSEIVYQSYINGKEKRGYFIYDGECITHNIDGIPPVYLIVPGFFSGFVFGSFNNMPRVMTSSHQHCPYHESLSCEGWTCFGPDDNSDNATVFIHGTTILHYFMGLAPGKPVIFDEFKPGFQTIDKFQPPKAAHCDPN